MELYRDLSGPSCVLPIKIVQLHVFTDSLCCLHWLNLASNKLDKMQKHSVFVLNRLQSIQQMCQKFLVQFGFIASKNNPADCVTCISSKQLLRSTFLVGPYSSNMLSEDNLGSNVTKVAIPKQQMMPIVNLVPSEGSERSEVFHCGSDVPLTSCSVSTKSSDFLLGPSHFSSFYRLVSLHHSYNLCSKMEN